MYDERHTWWAWAVKNAVMLICWTAMAIWFNHWWIALFAVFFMSSLEHQKPEHYRSVCDLCGRYSPDGTNRDDAEQKRIEAGWIRYKHGDKWEDICPACQEQHNIHQPHNIDIRY